MDALNQKIIDIITREPIVDQHALLAHLAQEGEHVTQSTLSRRLRKLRVTKKNGIYASEDRARSAGNALRSIEMAPPVFLVAHTLPGFANAIAAQLDACIPEKQEDRPVASGANDVLKCILGTIAGDDTVLIIAREGADLVLLKEEIESFLA